MDQDDVSKILAEVEPKRKIDVIEPSNKYELELKLITRKTGNIKIPVQIRIVGQNTLPTTIQFTANSIGPIMTCKQERLDFNKSDVLKTQEMKLVLVNQSIIPADYTMFTNNRESVFFIKEREGTIPEKGQKTIKVICSPDEAMKFNDILTVKVKHGNDLEIPLSCVGIGNTITSDINLSDIRFGDI